MTDLLLRPGAPNEYEVIADGQVVGHISLFSSSPAGTPWMWSIDFAFHDGREDTRLLGHTRGRHAVVHEVLVAGSFSTERLRAPTLLKRRVITLAEKSPPHSCGREGADKPE